MPSSRVQTISFASAANFTFDSSLVEFSGGKARLKLQTATVTKNQSFASSTGFTYDNTKATFSGGALRQADQTPTNSVLGANFADSSMDLDWNKGEAVTATLNGSPVITGGELDCSGGQPQGVVYSIGAMTQSGAIKFRYRPAYSGAPAGNRNIIGISASAGTANRLLLSQSGVDTLRITCNDSSNNLVWNSEPISPTSVGFVSGTQYELELNWNAATGDIHLLIGGVLWGTLNTAPWVFTTGPLLLRVGALQGGFDNAQAKFNDILLFNTIQHSTDYAPGYTVPTFIYAETSADLPAMTHALLGTYLSYDSLATTETASPRYSIKTGSGAFKYYSTAWGASDGSYSQANTKAGMNSYLPALTDASGATAVTMRVHFAASNVESSIDDLTLSLTAQTAYPTTPTAIVNNTGVMADAVESFAEVSATHAGSDQVLYALPLDDVDTFYDAPDWVASSGFADTNTPSDINANAATLDISSGKTVKVKTYLKSADGSTTPEIQTLTLGYNFYNVLVKPLTTTVTGFYGDISTNPVEGAIVTFYLQRKVGQYRNAGSLIVEKSVQAVTDALGRFEIDLIRTSEYGFGGLYTIEIQKTSESLATMIVDSAGNPILFRVPDADDVDITDQIMGAK